MPEFTNSFLWDHGKGIPEKEQDTWGLGMSSKIIRITLEWSIYCNRFKGKVEMTTTMTKNSHYLLFDWRVACFFHISDTYLSKEPQNDRICGICIKAHRMALHIYGFVLVCNTKAIFDKRFWKNIDCTIVLRNYHRYKYTWGDDTPDVHTITDESVLLFACWFTLFFNFTHLWFLLMIHLFY